MMDDQEILDGATHVDTDGFYWLISSQDKPQVYLCDEWTYCEPRSALRSLADIKELVELRNANAELEKERDAMEMRARAFEQGNINMQKVREVRDLEQQVKALYDLFSGDHYHPELSSNGLKYWAYKKIDTLTEQAKALKTGN